MRKYLSYFICSSFSIMIFFMYSTLVFNEKLNKSPSVEKGVMDAFILPGVALVFFSIVFLTYSHGAFIKYRKKEFGLFMTLGLSNRDIRKIILAENGIIALASIATGIASGAIFSRVFFLLLTTIIDIKDIPFSINYKSFFVTLGVFGLIFAFLILVTEIITGGFEIVRLLKEDRTPSKNKVSNGGLALIGLLILVGALAILLITFDKYNDYRGKILLICTIGCLIGLYITISQLGSTLIRFSKKRKKYHKNMLLLTNLEYKFSQTKKIVFTVAIMVIVTIFYTSTCLYWFLFAEKDAVDNNKYDIAFVQTQEINNISTERINSLIYSKENPVTEHKTIEFIEVLDLREGRASKFIFSDDELNELTDLKIHVNRGKYIKLIFNNYPSEGDKSNVFKPVIILNESGKIMNYSCEKVLWKMPFNHLNYIWDNTMILNSDDYNRIKNDVKNTKLGNVQLFNFKDWKKTKSIVTRLREDLKKESKNIMHNGTAEGDYYAQAAYYNCASKVERYYFNKQGAGISFFLSTFIGVFFFIATIVVLFLRLYSEIDNEKIKYKKLFKIGIMDKEIRKSIARELRVLFFTPPVIGIIIGTVYLTTFATCDGGLKSGAFREMLKCDFVMSSAYLVFQGIYYFIAKKKYCDEIIESLNS